VATKRDALHAAQERDAVISRCAGYHSRREYEMGATVLPGVGLVDLRTVREPGAR